MKSDIAQTKLLRVDSDMLHEFARLANDPNPIHLDEAIAKERGLPGRIAHGMLIASHMERFALECCLKQYGQILPVADIQIRFRDMTLMGETLTCEGVWKQLDSALPELHLTAKNSSTKVSALFKFKALKAQESEK